MNIVFNYLSNLPLLELTAMLLSLAYVTLAARGSLWCWPAAFISTAIYSVIFYDVLLLMDSALNIYYLIMAIYGYWAWTNGQSQSSIKVITWKINCHLKVIASLIIIALGLGYIMANYTPAHFPYLDSLTTTFAIFATYLVTQKVLENWLYWIVIDLASIYLYIEKGLLPTAILFIIYIIIAVYGYIKWRSLYQNNNLSQLKTR